MPYACKPFQYILPSDSPSSWSSSISEGTDEDSPPSTPPPRQTRAVRVRFGRGGRIHLDRRDGATRGFSTNLARSSLFTLDEDDAMNVDEAAKDDDLGSRLEERWKFDLDDGPAIGPHGADEEHRILVNDYDTT